MKILGIAFGLALGFTISFTASANKFSPVVERQYRESNITIDDALERSSVRTKGRRPGLGSFTRRVQNFSKNRTENRVSSTTSERRVRASSNRVFGGRNGYARYLRSLETDNSNRVSRLKRGRVDAANTADTEANTR